MDRLYFLFYFPTFSVLDSPELSSDPRDGKRCCIQEMLFPYHRNDDCRQLGFKFLENTFFPLKDFFPAGDFFFFLRRQRRKCLPCSSEGGGELGKGELGGEEGRKAQTALLTTQVEGAKFAPFSRQKIRGESIFLLIWLIIGQR